MTRGQADLGRASSLTFTPKFRKHKNGELSEQCLWTCFSQQIGCARLAWHDIEGTVLAPIQAAPEDLPVPNKFADAFPAATKNHEVTRSRTLSKCTPKVALHNGYEGFHVEQDNG